MPVEHETRVPLLHGEDPQTSYGTGSINQSITDDLSNRPVSQRIKVTVIGKKIGRKWKQLGTLLNVAEDVIENIDMDQHTVQDKAEAVVTNWQRITGRRATLDILIEKLQQLDCHQLIQEILTLPIESSDEEPDSADHCIIDLPPARNMSGDCEMRVPLLQGEDPQTSYGTGSINQSITDDLSNRPVSQRIKVTVVGKKIGRKWKQLGRLLKVPEDAIENIDINHPRVQDKAEAVVTKWQRITGRRATLDILIEKLQQLDCHQLIQEILTLPIESSDEEPDSADHCTIDLPPGQKTLSNVIHDLKKKYKGSKMTSLPWMKKSHSNLQTDYVQQDLVWTNREDKLGKPLPQQPIALDAIFKSKKRHWLSCERKPISILVEGLPGCGKSTLALKLCLDWAYEARYMRKFDIVILLILKQWEGSLSHMVCRRANIKYRQDVNWFWGYFNDASKNILIVLDGVDEVSSDQNSEIYSLFNGDICNHVSKVAFSRPVNFTLYSQIAESSMTEEEEKTQWDKRVKLLGIKESSQQKLLTRFSEKYDPSQRRLIDDGVSQLQRSSPSLSELLKSPLLLQIIITLLAIGMEPVEGLTHTHLYKGIFNYIFRRCFYRGVHSTVKFDLFGDKESNLADPYIELMRQFGCFALKALATGTNRFTRDEVLANPHSDERILDLGLLVFVKETYQPLHQSFLDFAAAYYVSVVRHNTVKAKILRLMKAYCFSNVSSFYFTFLIGLMNEKASLVFDILRPFARQNMSLKNFTLSLLQIKLTESLLLSLSPFIPVEFSIPSDINSPSFSTSKQHADIVRHATKTMVTKIITWDVKYATVFPEEGLIVDTLILRVTLPLTPLVHLHSKVTCTDLKFYLRKEKMPSWVINGKIPCCCLLNQADRCWLNIMQFIEHCTFNCISFDFDADAMNVWFPTIYDSITKGTLQRYNIKQMKCCFRRGHRELIPKLRQLMEGGKIEEVYATSESTYQLGVDTFYFGRCILSVVFPVISSHLLSFLTFIVSTTIRYFTAALISAGICALVLFLLSSMKSSGPIRIWVHIFLFMYILLLNWIFLSVVTKWFVVIMLSICFFYATLVFSHMFAHAFAEFDKLVPPSRTGNYSSQRRIHSKADKDFFQKWYLIASVFGSLSTIFAMIFGIDGLLGTVLFSLISISFLRGTIHSFGIPGLQSDDIVFVSLIYQVLSVVFTGAFYIVLSPYYLKETCLFICIFTTAFLFSLPLLVAAIISSLSCGIFACKAMSDAQIQSFLNSAAKSRGLKHFNLDLLYSNSINPQ